MRIEERFTLDVPVDEAFAFLSDVRRVAACVPGVEDMTEREDGSFGARLQVRLGPIKASFEGEVGLVADAAARRLTATGQGRDRGSGSRAEVAFSGDLLPGEAGGTEVVTVADVTIRGRLGQFGTGVIRATATEVLRDFVACANATLASDRAAGTAGGAGAGSDVPPGGGVPPDGPARGPASGAPAPSVGAGLVLRVVRSWLRDLLTRRG